MVKHWLIHPAANVENILGELPLLGGVHKWRHHFRQVSTVFTSDHPCIERIQCTLNTWVVWSITHQKWWGHLWTAPYQKLPKAQRTQGNNNIAFVLFRHEVIKSLQDQWLSDLTEWLTWKHWPVRLKLAARDENVLFWPKNWIFWAKSQFFVR